MPPRSPRASAAAGSRVPVADRIYHDMFERLLAAYGPQHWWPGKTPTEVAVGAILTQNTAWSNVQRALANLKRAGCLNWTKLRDLPEAELAELIRPAGTYRVKARRLKAFVQVLFDDFGGRLKAMCAGDGDLDETRRRLLTIHGVGRETADALLLYVGKRPTFVVDAYTLRVLRRHLLIEPKASYEDVRTQLQRAVPPDEAVYNEYHALFVAAGKHHCRARALCAGCPLQDLPHDPSL
ncbi:MAG TPA: endonuclease III domain-containing protein [Phycisphaerae bacterium]|nr:endonuclease III domain-containing protein [Phycisphaerae bacterium]HNU46343.1 endonuclease III domain-containing protein [Phycisphaerae bacterium]